MGCKDVTLKLVEHNLYFAMNVIQTDNHQKFSVTSTKILPAGVPKRRIYIFQINFHYDMIKEGISSA